MLRKCNDYSSGFEQFLDAIGIINGVVAVKNKFRDYPHLVSDLLAQPIADNFGMLGNDRKKILFFLKREDTYIYFSQRKIGRNPDLGNGDHFSLKVSPAFGLEKGCELFLNQP